MNLERCFGALLLVAVGLAAHAADPASPTQTSTATEAPIMSLQIKSSAFDANGPIPTKYTCDGENLSPPLSWTGVPDGTKSLVLIMDDPDAPPGTWVHWVLYDLPAGIGGLAEGLPKDEQLDSGASHGLCWGVSAFKRVGYQGPCPPHGDRHRYFFKLYALDGKLGLAPRADKPQVEKAMSGHILAQGQLVGTYER